jgi:hypothetical protein
MHGPLSAASKSNAVGGSATLNQGSTFNSPSITTSDALMSHLELRQFVSERVAECYASVADWSALHTSASEHQGLASRDTGYASWWAGLSQRMQSHFATASYDLAPGPAAVDVNVSQLKHGSPRSRNGKERSSLNLKERRGFECYCFIQQRGRLTYKCIRVILLLTWWSTV